MRGFIDRGKLGTERAPGMSQTSLRRDGVNTSTSWKRRQFCAPFPSGKQMDGQYFKFTPCSAFRDSAISCKALLLL